MTGNEIIATTYKTAEETHEMPSVTFTCAMLAETVRMVNCSAKRAAYGGKELPGSILEKWFYIAEEYYKMRHYLFAPEYCGKATDAFQKREAQIAVDGDLAKELKGGFANMLDIFIKMKKQEAFDEFLAFIKKVVPASFEAIRKPKRVFLDTDPVEYTERYITILPELEAKIEAELIDESQLVR